MVHPFFSMKTLGLTIPACLESTNYQEIIILLFDLVWFDLMNLILGIFLFARNPNEWEAIDMTSIIQLVGSRVFSNNTAFRDYAHLSLT